MSDPIKTQHGTIGILMSECEQLRRDLGNAKHDLGLWAAEFDKQWPKDVKMTIANLKADLAQAEHQTDLADRLAASNLKRVLVLEKELAQAKAELGAWHSAFGTTQLSHAVEKYEKAITDTRHKIAPTIELLDWLEWWLRDKYLGIHAKVKRELLRLQSITERKA